MSLTILKRKILSTSKDEDSAMVLMLVHAPSGDDEINEEFNTRCEHDYDCCGNWYTSVHRILNTKQPDQYIVLIRSAQNI
jgi:hypothetical protein